MEAEKSRLIDVLSRHQPNCAIKLKEIMKTYPSTTSGDTNVFRVPLPPASTVTSGGATSSTSGGHLQQLPVVQIPKIRISEPPQEPPSFADLIKEEEDPDLSTGYKEDPDISAGYMDASNNYYSHPARLLNSDTGYPNSDSFYNSTHPTSNHFLAKTHLGQTYLDLDSRCIAL